MSGTMFKSGGINALLVDIYIIYFNVQLAKCLKLPLQMKFHLVFSVRHVMFCTPPQWPYMKETCSWCIQITSLSVQGAIWKRENMLCLAYYHSYLAVIRNLYYKTVDGLINDILPNCVHMCSLLYNWGIVANVNCDQVWYSDIVLERHKFLEGLDYEVINCMKRWWWCGGGWVWLCVCVWGVGVGVVVVVVVVGWCWEVSLTSLLHPVLLGLMHITIFLYLTWYWKYWN